MKVALVYDRVNKWGGAERVLLALHKIFPNAPLYTSVYDKDAASWAKVFKVKPSFVQKIPFAKAHHEVFPFLMPLAFASFNFKKYDLVISVTSESAKNIRVTGKTKHVCICLTPTRYLWSGYHEYFKNKDFRLFTAPLVWLLRWLDRSAAQKPDAFVAISQEVQRRIKKYYKRDSYLVYPPLEKIKKVKKNSLFEKDYFLVVSRLSRFTTYKRVDLAVKAATFLGASLIVVGNGDIDYFKKFAGPTVHFTGKVTDEQLSSFYANCKALLFPGYEDFGLTMAEALSYGKPVIAYKAGGALEIVKEGKTGAFFSKQTVGQLVKALKSFKASQYNRNTCLRSVEKFSEKNFASGIRNVIRQVQHI